MRALVVVESVWGNTEALARAIVAGLGAGATLTTADAAPDSLPADLDLLVVGGPTHAFGMSRPETRASAREQGATLVPERGIREFIAGLGTPPRGMRVATFDTRTVSPRLPGSAAKKALKRLVGLGFEPLAKPVSFGVHGYTGPLAEGEVARAEAWGKEFAAALVGG
ncbi:flavodoxin family protein [Agromyces sp. MMS24-K17]|uniref:flavodoxin family protein n=1 Tax=Agromyces sp. MMS24-K17 TaxID=3372850 RepID=UPI003754F339